MTQPIPSNALKTPHHLWWIGALALLWNCAGAFDYVMTETRNSSYMSAFTPEQLAYFNAFPMWAVATWALGVWGGVLGSMLLLMRRRWSVPVFAISLAGMVLTFFYNYVLTNGFDIMGGAGALAFTGVILVVGVALLFYARALRRRGVLR